MGEKHKYLPKKLEPGQQVLTYDPVKLGFFHYFFDERSAGVNRVVENNMKGLEYFYPHLKPILIAQEFQENLFDDYQRAVIETHHIDRDTRLTEHDKNILRADFIRDALVDMRGDFKEGFIGENFLRGIDAGVTKGGLFFSEQAYNSKDPLLKNLNIAYRNHDFFGDYPADWIPFLLQFPSHTAPIPSTNNVVQLGLTTSMQSKLEDFFDGEAEVLRNSVVCSDFYKTDDGKDEKLRELFEKEGIVKQGEDIISYPVRIDQRKNVEEAIFLTHVLNKFHNGNYRLVVTATRDKDYQKQGKENVYQRRIEKFAEDLEVPVSLGKAYKFIDGKNFNVGNLYHISKLALTTAVKEGFGYAYVEPWVSGTPLIGRRIREVCEDFENNGMKFRKNLYDGSVLRATRNWRSRLERLEDLLNNSNELEETVKRLDLPSRIEYAEGRIDHNAKTVEKVYGHIPVARDMIKLLQLPGHEKLNGESAKFS